MVVNGLTQEELNSKNVIYCALFKNGKRYIGLTSTKLSKRIYQHKLDSSTKNKTVFHNAINKYGFENIEWSVLEKSNVKDKLAELEIKYIEEFNTYIGKPNCNGYNSTIGGDGVSEYCEEILHKIRGSKNSNAVLNENIVEKIKIDFSNGLGLNEVHKKYKVNINTLNGIKRCLNWAHVRADLNDIIISKLSTIYKPTIKEVENIKSLMFNGFSNIEISNILNINFGTISSIRVLRSYKDVLPEYNETIVKNSVSRIKLTDEQIKIIKANLIEKRDSKYISELLGFENDRNFKQRILDIKTLKRFTEVHKEYNDELRRLYGQVTTPDLHG